MKRKRFILITLLLVAAGVIWSLSRHDEKIEVQGNLSAKEVAEIKKAVHSELSQDFFSRSVFSWPNIKNLPYVSRRFFRIQLISITVPTSDSNTVVVGLGKSGEGLDSVELIKGTNGWEVDADTWHFTPDAW